MDELLFYVAACPNPSCSTLAYKWVKPGDSCRCGWGATPGPAVFTSTTNFTLELPLD